MAGYGGMKPRKTGSGKTKTKKNKPKSKKVYKKTSGGSGYGGQTRTTMMQMGN
jgi:hypothetical protein